MAKEKSKELVTTPERLTEEQQREIALTVLDAEYSVNDSDRVILPDDVIDAAAKHAEDHDEYHTYQPKDNEAIICRFVGAKRIDIVGQHEANLVALYDYRDGRVKRVWLGDHVVVKIAGARLHQTGKPFCLTYRGKVPSKRRKDKWAHAWNFYVYTDEERKKLFPVPVAKDAKVS